MLQVLGILHLMFDERQVSAHLSKRDFVLRTADKPEYPQYLKFELTNERCEQLDAFNPGDALEVSFYLKGREWVNPRGEKVYITTLEAWKLRRPDNRAHKPEPPPTQAFDMEGEDLPF